MKQDMMLIVLLAVVLLATQQQAVAGILATVKAGMSGLLGTIGGTPAPPPQPYCTNSCAATQSQNPYPSCTCFTPTPVGEDKCAVNLCTRAYELSPTGFAHLDAECAASGGAAQCDHDNFICWGAYPTWEYCMSAEAQLFRSYCIEYCGIWHCSPLDEIAGCTR